MSEEIRLLQNSIASYALEHSINEIPQHYFEKTAITWQDMNDKGYNWDQTKAAATLLYASVIDGIIHKSQMTPQGYRAIDWAERFLQKFENLATEA